MPYLPNQYRSAQVPGQYNSGAASYIANYGPNASQTTTNPLTMTGPASPPTARSHTRGSHVRPPSRSDSGVNSIPSMPNEVGSGGAPRPTTAPVRPAVPVRPPTVAGPSFSTSAPDDPRLTGLADRYGRYLDDFESGTGKIMDIAGSKLRDAREGGRKALAQSEKFRGVASSGAMGDYETETQGQLSGTLADIAVNREREYGAAMRGAVPMYRAPRELNLQERSIGINAYNAQNAAQQGAFAQMMALMDRLPDWLGQGASF